MKCPQCGAEYPNEPECEARFHRLLALEYADPVTFGAVHHLSVPCYMLQHNAYSRVAWLEARRMLARFVREEIPPAAVSRERRSIYDGAHRTWSVTKGQRVPGFDTIVWTRTIADVRMDDPVIYRADVERWAASVVADTEAFVRRIPLSADDRG